MGDLELSTLINDFESEFGEVTCEKVQYTMAFGDVCIQYDYSLN